MALNVRLFQKFRYYKKALTRCYTYPVVKDGKLASNHKLYAPNVDLDKELENDNKGRVGESIENRNLKLDIIHFKSSCELLKNMEGLREGVNKKLKELCENLKILKKKLRNDTSEETKEQLRKTEHQIEFVKEDLSSLLMAVQSAKIKVNSYCLKLPNFIHEETPRNEDKLVYEFGTPPKIRNARSHLSIGQNLGVIHYRNPSRFFLMNEAAEFELGSSYFFSRNLNDKGFTCFSNPDFAKRVLIEGSGVDLSPPNNILTLQDKTGQEIYHTLHLVGGSSIYPFCGFHANQTMDLSCLPLKYFTTGRQYNRTTLKSELGLYETWQKTTCEIFILTGNDHREMMLQFERALAVVISIYEKLDYHFRVDYVKASDLENREILRASFKMFSPYHRKYIEIGNLSIIDSYICRRLIMSYENENKSREYMKMISGTVVNITKLLACILEQNNDEKKFRMPPCLESHRLL